MLDGEVEGHPWTPERWSWAQPSGRSQLGDLAAWTRTVSIESPRDTHGGPPKLRKTWRTDSCTTRWDSPTLVPPADGEPHPGG